MANILVFLYMFAVGVSGDAEYMATHGAVFFPYMIKNGMWYPLVTAMFLHFDIEHLANNMVMLVAVGRYVEKDMGTVKFVLVYFVSGVLGNILSLARDMRTEEFAVSAGASGAVFGLVGALLSMLNYTYGTNGIPMPGDMPYAVDMLNEAEVVEDLKEAEETADFTIVCPHWGTEYNPGITEEQKKWAKIFEENGADLIIGTHPHVIEPIEMIDDIPVYYSLGNFVNWTSGTGDGVCARMVGGMAEVTIIRDENDQVTVKDHGVRAIVCHVEPGYHGITVLPLSEYSADMAGKNAIISQDPAFSYDKCVSICNDVWGEGNWE